MTNTNGFIVVYENEYGADAWAALTERGAKDSIYLMMLDWMGDLSEDSEQKEILNLIKTDQFDDAVALWNEVTSERFEVIKFSLNVEDDKLRKETLGDRLKEVTKRLAQGDDGVEVWPADDPE